MIAATAVLAVGVGVDAGPTAELAAVCADALAPPTGLGSIAGVIAATAMLAANLGVDAGAPAGLGIAGTDGNTQTRLAALADLAGAATLPTMPFVRAQVGAVEAALGQSVRTDAATAGAALLLAAGAATLSAMVRIVVHVDALAVAQGLALEAVVAAASPPAGLSGRAGEPAEPAVGGVAVGVDADPVADDLPRRAGPTDVGAGIGGLLLARGAGGQPERQQGDQHGRDGSRGQHGRLGSMGHSPLRGSRQLAVHSSSGSPLAPPNPGTS